MFVKPGHWLKAIVERLKEKRWEPIFNMETQIYERSNGNIKKLYNRLDIVFFY